VPIAFHRATTEVRPTGDDFGASVTSSRAQHLGRSKATTSELVDRLAAKGPVARMRDDRNRRRVFGWLTDAGRARARAHPRVLGTDDLTKAIESMRPADRAALLRGLTALLATGLERLEAERATRTYLRGMPAWRDHPALSV
jgi:DNA-binding MarR family transcriptional regulator